MKKIVLLLFVSIITFSSISAQENGSAFFGINVGGFFANKNTSILYTGADASSNYGVEDLFSNTINKPIFDNYFQYPYAIVELPQKWNPR